MSAAQSSVSRVERFLGVPALPLRGQPGISALLLVVVAALSVTACSTSSTAGHGFRDTAQFRGDASRSGRLGGGIPQTVPAQAWSFRKAGIYLSDPITSNGSVFVGASDGTVYSLDAETG